MRALFPGFRSVRQKLFAGVLLTSLAALLIAGASLFVYDVRNYRDSTARNLAVEAELLGNVTMAAIEFDDRALAAQNLSFLKARPNVRAAAIFNPRGALFASYVRPDVSKAELPALPGTDGAAIEGERVAVFHRILANNQIVGTVYLAQDLGMFERAGTYAAILFAVMLAALVVAAMLSEALQKGITRPIIQISSLAREVVEKRDYNVRATRTTRDEIGTLVDAFNAMLSEIQRRTDALDESEEGLRRAQTLAGLAHVVSDSSGAFERWSETFPKMVQRDEHDMPRDTRAWLAFVHPDDRALFRARAIEAGTSNRRTEAEYRLVRADGSHAYIMQVMEPMGDADSSGGRHWFSTLLDVTEQKRAAQLEESNLQLKSASSAKSTFLSTMSHEIRTPMNGVLGMLELLALTDLDAQQKATLDIVRNSGRSLLRIIDDILDFSKIEAGKLEIRPEPASVSRVVESVVGIYAGNASNKALVLRSYTDPRISPAVIVDPIRLQQILNNLVSNAIKFTSKGFVEIRAELVERRRDVDVVRFLVKDTGIGIAPEAQAKLFQPFEQAGGEITRVFGGTGLGLSIGDRLARMMGGSIEISSRSGIGTTVSVTLPLPVAAPETLPSVGRAAAHEAIAAKVQGRRRAPSVEQAEKEGTLVLVVDDHPINRMVLERQVKILGYANESAEDGRQALELWKSGRFGAVVTDCNMPEMDGYELARAIRAMEAENGLARTPIIACTANALKGEADNCLAAGMDDYVAKPVDLTTLVAKLDQWLPLPKETGEGSDDERDSPVDRSVLARIAGDDADLERELLSQFMNTNRNDMRLLERALQKKDIAHVIDLAHRIKGATRTIGAKPLADVCARMEAAARTGDWESVAANEASFHREAARLNAHFASLGLVKADS